MHNVFIGEYIKQRRLDLGLTQEQVCEGICEPVTISRIENGHQTPSRTRINAILQRLGLPDDRYYALLSKKELEIQALKKEIASSNSQLQIEKCSEKINSLEHLADPDDHITQQFILRSKALLGRHDGSIDPKEQIDLLLKALRLTVPRFDLDEINSCLYTFDEAKIINQIALAYSDAKNNKKAADIYYQLLKYIHKHFQEVLTSNGMYPMVLFNYARVLDLCGRYEEGAEYALKGRDACIEYGHFQFFADCLAIHAECCHFLGKDTESAKSYRQAYYLLQALGEDKNVETVRQEAKKYLGITLPELFTAMP